MAQEPIVQGGPVSPEPPVAPGFSSEQQLVAAILRRDRKAAAQFVAQHTDAIYAYIRYRLAPRSDLVEDLVQEVFLAALQHLEHFRGTSSLRSWLLGIARHKVEDYYRKQLRAPEPIEEDGDEPAADLPLPDEALDRERARAKARQILQRLAEPYSLALLWRYWEHRSVRDMALMTGRTEKAIERTLARARARFRALWEQAEDED